MGRESCHSTCDFFPRSPRLFSIVGSIELSPRTSLFHLMGQIYFCIFPKIEIKRNFAFYFFGFFFFFFVFDYDCCFAYTKYKNRFRFTSNPKQSHFYCVFFSFSLSLFNRKMQNEQWNLCTVGQRQWLKYNISIKCTWVSLLVVQPFTPTVSYLLIWCNRRNVRCDACDIYDISPLQLTSEMECTQ